MATIGNKLASLVVDIVINTRRLQSTLHTSTQNVQNSANQMRSALTRIGLAASAFLLIRKAVDLTLEGILATVQAAARLEKQIIDTTKVAKFPDPSRFAEGFIKLGQTLKGVSFAQLGDIGADLARLGLRGGSKSFLEFLNASASLSQVTGDIDLRQAGEGIGKILANFGQLGADAGKNALELSVAINKLSDDFPVTAGEILNVTQKLSGFAAAVGLSKEQTLALTTLIKQTGISSTVVESSLTRLLITLEKDPHGFAASIGKTGDDITKFANLVATDPFAAVKEFFDFLKTADASTATKTLVDLELATSRNAVAYLNAVAKIQDWDKALGAATTSAQSMLAFFNKQNASIETMDAKLIGMKNSWEGFKASLGEASGFKVAVDSISGLLQSLTDLDTKIPTDFKKPEDILKKVDELTAELERKGSLRDFIEGGPLSVSFPSLIKRLGGSKELQNEIDRLLDQYKKVSEQRAKDAQKPKKDTKADKAKIEAQNKARKEQFDEALKEFAEVIDPTPFTELEKKVEEFKEKFPDFIKLDEFDKIVAARRQEIADKISKKFEEDALRIAGDKDKEFADLFGDVDKLVEAGKKISPIDYQEKLDEIIKKRDELITSAFDLSTSVEDFKNKRAAIAGKFQVGAFIKNAEDAFTKQLDENIGDSLLGKFDLPGLDKLKEFSIMMATIPGIAQDKFALEALFPDGGRKFSGMTEAWKEAQTKSSITKDQIDALKGILKANGIANEFLEKIAEKIGLEKGALK